ncbi:MAG TPA: helix-turn-helix transcriptional regulator [Candidatus Saccharimonadales bacterium]|nr:helix-turn-helix transcriptional regulator [Candidatus Saccharimonadales bacterium]
MSKINQAVKRGDLIAYDDLFSSYPKKRQQEILEKARYLKAAMELKKLRKELKISQEELARKMKVKREFIARIESGEQNITIETLNRVAEATGKELKFHFI